MMNLNKLGSAKLPLRYALPATAIVTLSIMGVEWRALYNLDHPKPHNVDCLSCHSDKHTLDAMAEKAGDPLYLVHSGRMTLADLNRRTGRQNDPGAAQTK